MSHHPHLFGSKSLYALQNEDADDIELINKITRKIAIGPIFSRPPASSSYTIKAPSGGLSLISCAKIILCGYQRLHAAVLLLIVTYETIQDDQVVDDNQAYKLSLSNLMTSSRKSGLAY